MKKDLNIVTLNIPYPPDYGGMIDSFYRIKWLNNAGISIHLHCFEYGRQHSVQLESLCETVKYYPRETTVLNHFSIIPYIVRSRSSIQLLNNLKANDFPILFDGLHCTFFLNHPYLNNRRKFVRAHNIEKLYYRSLAANESNLIKKLYFLIESQKLDQYEKTLKGADCLFPLSLHDYEFFKRFSEEAICIAPFHPYDDIISLPGKGEYILYHGDMSVKENSIIAESLINKVFSRVQFKCIIAGKNPPANILAKAKGKNNISIIPNPGSDEMEKLIRDAHINLLPVLTSNGFKMKLLMSLYAGRHCLVNKTASSNFQNTSLFHIAENHNEIIDKINHLMNEEFTSEMIRTRKNIIEEKFSNQTNVQKLIDIIFS